MKRIEIVVGAARSLSAAFFQRRRRALAGKLVVLPVTVMGLVMFMLFASGHPFRGDLGLQPEP